MTLSADEVLTWAVEWIYVPPGCPTVDTPEYLVVAHPPTWADPTGAFRVDSARPPAELVDEIVSATTRLDRDAVTVWVHDDTRPAGLADELVRRGAELVEELAVLARAIDELPDLDVPDDVEVRLVTDLSIQRDMDRVGVEVFGGSTESDDALRDHLDRRNLERDRLFVGYLDDVPVGAAGLVVADEVLRLWGGSVVEYARGRGVYRALLARRLSDGRDRGCRAALVTGRVTTSAPVLRRAGFEQYGMQRGYRLRLA